MNHFTIKFYGVNDQVEHDVRRNIEKLVGQYKLQSLVDPLYTCVKELIINAIKANYKNIFFEGYSPDISENALPYDTALQVFKLELTRAEAVYFEELAERNNIEASLFMQIENGRFQVIVENPVAMTPSEQERVKRKLVDAGECEDIGEYFMKHSDSMDEGAGLGLVLIAIMLKSLGGAIQDFLIFSKDNKTTASFSIPLVPASQEE